MCGIQVILIVGLRSITFGLLSLIPNLIPAAMAYGLWGFAVGRIGLGLSIVVGITLGIVVDDTIYVMSTYMQARRTQGLPPAEAIRYTFAHVGMAVWFASLILIAGFAVLIFSNFEINAGLGLLSAITIALAAMAEVFFLPPLLLYAERMFHGHATIPEA
jgi:predicted RND superfamily exporter protein